jgi:N-terminal region of glycosyl transferase group 7/N-terminal domain of galactosyltransferase
LAEAPVKPRLNIVVPYRAREAHLNIFVQMVRAYFARDKVDRDIPYSALIIEQENGLPFNRGALKNIGFVLGKESSDYTCFHDVDYIPVWADYSWSDVPMAIVWYGAESRPIRLSHRDRGVRHDLNKFYGGAALMPNELFEKANGYTNANWGWGPDDLDLKHRFGAIGVEMGRRKGTFQPLDHDSEAYELDGSPSAAAQVSLKQLKDRWELGIDAPDDGLSNLRYQILDRRKIPEGPVVERPATWEMVKVRLEKPPGN